MCLIGGAWRGSYREPLLQVGAPVSLIRRNRFAFLWLVSSWKQRQKSTWFITEQILVICGQKLLFVSLGYNDTIIILNNCSNFYNDYMVDQRGKDGGLGKIE